ncbi:MAG: regulatory protein RecX, partial [Methylococcaceae bacterium]
MNPVAQDIKNHCLRLLARREHSQKELLTKSMQKGFSRAEIEPVLTELAENNWQSDARFAENYARARLRKGYGATAIRYELSQKGIDVADT